MNFGREVDQEVAFGILDAAFASGIRFVDTAELYPHPSDVHHLGVAEEILGRWLRSKPRDSIVISTKISGPTVGSYRSPARGGFPGLDGTSVRRAVEASLGRLGVDYIDVIQPHWPDSCGDVDSMLRAVTSLATEGKIRVFGTCNQSPWGLMKLLWRSDVLGALRPESIQLRHNLISTGLNRSIEEVLVQEEIGLIAYEPLASGVLTGKYLTIDSNVHGSRFRPGHSCQLQESLYFSEFAVRVAKAVSEIARANEVSPAALALAANLCDASCAVTVVGGRNAGQIEELSTAMDLSAFAPIVGQLRTRLAQQSENGNE